MLIPSTTVGGRCPLCGERHAACGQPTTTVPVDQRIEEAGPMAEVRTYTLTVGGTERRFKLSQSDAEKLDATPVDEPTTKAKTPANKSRTPRNKAES